MTWPQGLVDPLLSLLHLTGMVSEETESQEHQKRIPLASLRDLMSRIGFCSFFHRRFELGLNNLLVAYKPTGRGPAERKART